MNEILQYLCFGVPGVCSNGLLELSSNRPGFSSRLKKIRPSKQTCNGTPRSNLHPKGSSIWLSTAPNSRLRGEKAFGDLSHCYPLGERENISHLEKKRETHLQNWHFRGYVIVPRKVCISLQKLVRSGGKHEETWDVDHDSWRTPKRSLLTPEKDT